MGNPIAKQGDRVVGVDTHVVIVATVPTPMPIRFDGELEEDVSPTVFIDDKPAATVGSIARDKGGHVPVGGEFQKPPSKMGSVSTNSVEVYVDDKRAARIGDPVRCCNDPSDRDTASIQGRGTVVTD
jgi:uncharacterized Zn-binding protein involved in type VI secretion